MKYQRRNDLIAEKVDNNLVVMNHETGRLITLNETAALIWDLIENETEEEVIARELKKTYENTSNLKEDLREVLEVFKKENLLLLH